jgi:hypothetical protein
MLGYMNLYSVTHSPYIRQQQDFRAALTLNCRQASSNTLKIRLARFLRVSRSPLWFPCAEFFYVVVKVAFLGKPGCTVGAGIEAMLVTRRDTSNNIIPTLVRAHQFSILHISQEAPQVIQNHVLLIADY